MIPEDFDPATSPPPFLIRLQNNRFASPTLADDASTDSEKRAAEEAEQLEIVDGEVGGQPWATLFSTKFERVILDWRPEAKDSLYADKGFASSDLLSNDFSTPNQPTHITLSDLLHIFSAPEDMVDSPCDKKECSSPARLKRLSLYTLPDVFIVHLKRFKWFETGGYGYNKKIETMVEFSVDWEVQGAKYRLFAVVNHYGSTFSGHCEYSLVLSAV